MNIMKKHILEESAWPEIKQIKDDVIVLPWGATEAHNLHLPYGTDNYLAADLADASAALACESGAHVIVLPVVPYGVNTGQDDITLDMNLNPGTQFMILKDLLTVLYRQSFRKFVILNAHGGNDFKQHIRELNLLFPGMVLVQCNYFKLPGAENFFEDLGEHAGELETSLMMHLHPDLVRPLSQAGDGHAKKFRVEELNQGWAWAERKWSKVTRDTGIGNPAKATAEKGRVYFLHVAEKVSRLLISLWSTSPDDFYV